MFSYVIRRLLFMVPTIVGILLINFLVVNMAPGGPIEQLLSNLNPDRVRAVDRVGAGEGAVVMSERYDSRAARGIDPQLLEKLERQLNLDKPVHERFLLMLRNYLTFDFGESFFKNQRVVDLVLEKMPVSISIGLWTTLLTYLICIPLGIAKAVRDGSRFDIWTSGVIIVGNAVPSFILAVLLIIVFATGSPFSLFPLQGLVSEGWAEMSLVDKILDYFWHLVLPITAMAATGLATMTLLTKNSFLEEINKQYVVTARSKGLADRRVLYGHVFRNAMLIVIAGFPAAFVEMLFAGSLFIEVIFNLDGLGLLGYESVVNRDYPVFFATIYFFSLIGLLVRLITDLMYVWIDPRIDFESRQV